MAKDNSFQTLLENLEKQRANLSKINSSAKLRNLSVHTDVTRETESTIAKIKLDGLKKYYEMRQSWGNFLKWCLGIILGFNIVLVISVGLGILIFNDEWFLRIVLTTHLADIIGLAYLVVNFLFSNQVEFSDAKEAGK